MKTVIYIFKSILAFFKLTDVQGNLSLTNLAFYIFLYKIATCSMGAITANDLAIAMTTAGLYFGKKVVNAVKDIKGVGPMSLMNSESDTSTDNTESSDSTEQGGSNGNG